MKRCSMLFALALLSAVITAPAQAQDPAGGLGGHQGNLFAEFSAANLGQGTGFISGASAGGYLQGPLLGLVMRATAAPGGDTFHVYSAVLGPRIAFDLPVLRPFIEAGGGIGHSSYYNSGGNFARGWGPAWQIDAGVEHSLLPRVQWRVLEVAWGHIDVGPGVAPTVISSGLTLHLW